MKNSIYLAVQYLKFYRLRSILLIAAIAIILFLPNGLKKLISDSEHQLMDRAEVTPLIIGGKGSSSDLVLNTLYFQQEKIAQLKMQDVNEANATSFGEAIPIFSAFHARKYPIVGTDLDYLDFRNLKMREGRRFSYIGECVVGATVASSLNLQAGDHIVSSPENFFDIAGVYPLKMKITGVLEQSYTPDDKAIFTDLKTTWVIAGLGHGHDNPEEINDPSIVLNPGDSNLATTAKLKMYQEITETNRDKIHFHGDENGYPISSIIFKPTDQKSATLLRGRFEAQEMLSQITVPAQVIQNLIQRIFRIQQLFDLMFILVGLATFLIFMLIMMLSVRLRKVEIDTLFILGSSKGKLFQMLGVEILILLLSSSFIALILYQGTGLFVDYFIQKFILS